MATCAACERIGRIRAGEGDPSLIAELRESFVVLHEHQPYEGWCVLLLKDHAEHLHGLERARVARLAEDVAEVGRAVMGVCGARRINYECLGNQMAHVHWHVVPRYEAPRDPDPRNAVWVQPEAFLRGAVPSARRGELIHKIRAALGFRAA
jgi:diadenosine tetraphosphate (Ap4A) HIT family hydrolase